jgi:hypothetical protein
VLGDGDPGLGHDRPRLVLKETHGRRRSLSSLAGAGRLDGREALGQRTKFLSIGLSGGFQTKLVEMVDYCVTWQRQSTNLPLLLRGTDEPST